jgi:hypothetical protein
VSMLCGDPVNWGSKKQKPVAQSSCESELYSSAAAMNELKWFSGLMKELGIRMTAKPLLYGDNQSAQALTTNGVKSERTKHIDIKYRYITDEVSKGNIELKWIPTTEQLADILTKSLPIQTHQRLCKQLVVPCGSS